MKNRLLYDIEVLKTSRGYLMAGFPYFGRLFGRDTCISAWQLLKIQPDIAESTLRILAKYQGKKVNLKREEEPGKILHEHFDEGFPQKIKDLFKISGKWGRIRQHFTWQFPYYGSIDSTAWWLILLSEYSKKTGDRELVRKLWPNVLRALHWIEKYGDSDQDGFIEFQRKNPHGLFHQSWKDGLDINIRPPIAMVEVQGYYYLAYKKIGKLAEEIMGNSRLKEKLERKAKVLKKEFNQKFWIEDQNCFALALDGRKKQIGIVASNPGHCLFSGIIDKGKVEKVVGRLFEKDMWTPYGIRTHSTRDPNFNSAICQQGSIWPHDNWIIYVGLRKYGYYKEAKMIKKALISAYKVLSYIPELYGVKKDELIPIEIASHPQAWCCGALLNLLSESG